MSNRRANSLPAEFQADDVRYSESLVEHFLNEYTNSGDVVFDPFMGFGTTLLVAEKLDRVGFGIEYDEKRCNYVKSMLKHPERALLGDSTKLDSVNLPDFDFSITSPPYMGKHHEENPFTAYSTEFSGYQEYLGQIEHIYRQLCKRLKASRHAVIEVSNLKHEDGTITTLAWDIARAVSNVLDFQGEVVIAWDETYGYGYDHSYCLVFTKK